MSEGSWESVWYPTRNKVWDQAESETVALVWGTLRAYLWGEVADQVDAQVSDQVDAQVSGQFWREIDG